MKKYFSISFFAALLLCCSLPALAVTHAPYFTGGHTLNLTVCQNSGATAINALLSVSDIDAGQTETWSIAVAAPHGTAVVSYSTTSTGGTLIPSGLTYMPNAGYSGNDTFNVMVSDGSLTDVTTVYVTVNPLPSAGTITGPSSVCTGSSIALTDATTGGGWTVSNSTASVLGGIVTGLVGGIDTIRYSVTNSCGTTTATYTVTINATPVAGTIAGPASVCVGSVITLTDAASGGVWSASNGVATVSGGTVTGMTAGIDTIMYTVTTACGTASTSTTITVNPLALAGTITGPSSVCVSGTSTLTDAVAGGAWTSSNATATISGGVVTGVTAGVDTIIYTVTTACGTAAATMSITINPLPDAGSVSYTGFASMCITDSILLTETVSGGVWSSTNLRASVSAAGWVTGLIAGKDTVMYSVTNGCGTATATHTVVVKPNPNAGAITGASAVCTGKSITLSDASGGGVWSSSKPSAAKITSAGVVSGVTPGTATITYTVTNDCGTATTTTPMSVDLPALPIFDSTDKVCPFGVLVLIDLTTGGTWSSSNLLTAAVFGGVVLGITPGVATITYTVNNGCGTTTATLDVTVLTAAECGTVPLETQVSNTDKEGLQVYPNPNNGDFSLSVSAKTNEEVQVVITNAVGQKVRTFAATTNKVSEMRLDVPAGVYFITVVTANNRYTGKMTVSK